MAFLVSSSTDPREYIQRLGRVLRLDKEGNKQYAIVYDFIVTPPENIIYESESDRTIARNLLKNELIRAKFFINLSVNSEEAQIEVDDIANNYLFNFSEEELSYNINKESEV
jgi:superfamily II DNA or RNA helicase